MLVQRTAAPKEGMGLLVSEVVGLLLGSYLAMMLYVPR